MYGDAPVRVDTRPKCLPLLAYLVLNAGSAMARRTVAIDLWPDDNHETARANLRRHLHYLMLALPANGSDALWLRSDSRHIAWDPQGPWSCDVLDFVSLAKASELERALDVYRGDLLEGIDDEWVLPKRDALRNRWLGVAYDFARSQQERGDTAGTIATAQRILAADEFNEAAFRVLITTLAAARRRNEALALAAQFERRLHDQLETDVDEETAGCIRAIRRDESGAANPSNLPNHLTSFLGRGRELDAIRDLFVSRRLVSLVGPGGIGKTRLAIEIAASLLPRFRDGVYLVDLSALSEGSEILQTVISTLNLSLRSLSLEALCEALASRECLVILDNCEHLIEPSAKLGARILRCSPKTRMLVTSREPLDVAGETVYRVPTLQVPPPGEAIDVAHLAGYEAIAFFVERASYADPGFSLRPNNAERVTSICRRLDGIPLALELAAGRVGVANLSALERDLNNFAAFRINRDAPERHQTLFAAIEWGYDLLSESEQALLTKLAVFEGTFTIDAASAIAQSEGLARAHVQATIERLTNKSSLQAERSTDGLRYRMLETIRAFAEAKGEPADRTRLRAAHAAYYARRVLELCDEVLGLDQGLILQQISLEYANIVAAMQWSFGGAGNRDLGFDMVIALRDYWDSRGSHAEAERWIDLALENSASDAQATPRTRARHGKLHLRAAQTAFQLRDPKAHSMHAHAALDLLSEEGDPFWISIAYNLLSHVSSGEGDLASAEGLLLRALEHAERSGDPTALGAVHNNLGYIYSQSGDLKESRREHELALALRRRRGNPRMVAWSLGTIAAINYVEGDYAQARRGLEESLAIRTSLGDLRGIADVVHDLGDIASARGDFENARLLYVESLRRALEIDDVRCVAQCIEGLAGVAAHANQAQLAATLLGAAQTERRRIGVPAERPAEATNQQTLERLEALLGPAVLAENLARGCALGIDEATRRALIFT